MRRKAPWPEKEQATLQFSQFFCLTRGFAARVQGSRWVSIPITVTFFCSPSLTMIIPCCVTATTGGTACFHEILHGREIGKQKYSRYSMFRLFQSSQARVVVNSVIIKFSEGSKSNTAAEDCRGLKMRQRWDQRLNSASRILQNEIHFCNRNANGSEQM